MSSEVVKTTWASCNFRRAAATINKDFNIVLGINPAQSFRLYQFGFGCVEKNEGWDKLAANFECGPPLDLWTYPSVIRVAGVKILTKKGLKTCSIHLVTLPQFLNPTYILELASWDQKFFVLASSLVLKVMFILYSNF